MVEPRSLAALEAELLAGPTATEALRRWCAAHCGEAGRISAHRVAALPLAPPAEIETRLACGCGEAIRHRRVELRWGAAPLSTADNWYVPERLTPEMNGQLATGDHPFGEIVAPLGVARRILSSDREPGPGAGRRSETPSPDQEETRAPCVAGSVSAAGGELGRISNGRHAALRQHALLIRVSTGEVLAAVSETYLQAVLEIGLG